MYVAVESIVQSEDVETTAVCEVLGVSRSAYYAWRSREPSAREARDLELTPLVREVFWKHRRRYGAFLTRSSTKVSPLFNLLLMSPKDCYSCLRSKDCEGGLPNFGGGLPNL